VTSPAFVIARVHPPLAGAVPPTAVTVPVARRTLTMVTRRVS
jgi:hypothetical protein